MEENLKKLISGLLMIVVLSAIFSLFLMVFYVKAADIDRVRNCMLMQNQQKKQPVEPKRIPRITRWDFTFKLPVTGEKDSYHWVVKGGIGQSIDPDKDRISPFYGKFMENGEPVVLKSPTAIFDKNRRALTSTTNVLIEMPWSAITGRGFRFNIDDRFCKIFNNSHTTIEKEKAGASSMVGNPAPPAADDADDTAGKDKKQSVLQIDSKQFYYYGDDNRQVWKENVFAWDSSGVIKADRMEAIHYSDEEKAENPELSSVKKIICTGNVKIDQGTKWAVSDTAIHIVKTDILILTVDPGKRAVYWEESSDKTTVTRVSARKIISYRKENRFDAIEGQETALNIPRGDVDKIRILGFDSKKLGLFVSKMRKEK